MVVLGIESSCDETACAIVRDGTEVLSNVVYTQIKLHQPWGGVVPEIASRAHVEKISGVIAAAVDEAVKGGGLKGLSAVDAVAGFLASVSPDLPLHVTRFFPRWRFLDAPPTPVATVRRLADIARRRLRRVLVGTC